MPRRPWHCEAAEALQPQNPNTLRSTNTPVNYRHQDAGTAGTLKLAPANRAKSLNWAFSSQRASDAAVESMRSIMGESSGSASVPLPWGTCSCGGACTCTCTCWHPTTCTCGGAAPPDGRHASAMPSPGKYPRGAGNGPARGGGPFPRRRTQPTTVSRRRASDRRLLQRLIAS